MALVDAAEVGKAKAAFLTALVQARLAARNYDRVKGLASASPKEVDEAFAAHAEARIAQATAQQALTNLGLPVDAAAFDKVDNDDLPDRLRFLGVPKAVADTLDAKTTTGNLLPVVAPQDGLVATRDVVAWLKCYYMQDRVGEEFSGCVSAVVPFGLFVALDDIFIEGLVHISDLGSDYFHFDEARHELVGERSNARCLAVERSQATISAHISCTVISGTQPSFSLASVGSPSSVSTSAGRKYRGSTATTMSPTFRAGALSPWMAAT